MNKEKSLILAKKEKDEKKYEEVYVWDKKYQCWVLEEKLIKDKKEKNV
jgi:hypothetical protein